MMSHRQPFTPQRSPSRPASIASPSSSEQAGRANNVSPPDEEGVEERGEPSGVSSNDHSSSWSALRGWTAHQSHGQATILFYVPRWTRHDALDISIGSDYVIAGMKGRTPIVKARLAGRIHPDTSSWQLEKQSSKRRRSVRNRPRTRTRTNSLGYHSSSSNASAADGDRTRKSDQSSQEGALGMAERSTEPESSTSKATLPLPASSRHSRQRNSAAADGSHPRSNDPSRPISPAQSEASSFDLLGRSTDTLGSALSGVSHPAIVSDGRGLDATQASPQQQHDASAASPALSSPNSLSQSMTLSDGTGEYIQSIGSGGVRSLESSVSFDRSHTSSDSSRRRVGEGEGDHDPIWNAKLVTLHLDKAEGGIWPCIVSGPAPLEDGGPEQLCESDQSPFLRQSSFNAALSEALRKQSRRSDSISLHSITSSQGDRQGYDDHGSSDEVRTNESTATIDTIGSDDDTTVLGTSIQSQDTEKLYNMDPISLTLLGLWHARRSTQTPFEGKGARDEMRAFECLRRAWREAEVPAAIECLVHNYLPVHLSTSTILASYRQRLTAALGGPSALARLYVSYAHLNMPSYEYRKPLLSLPMSGLTNNPFGVHISASPRLNVEVSEPPVTGPLQYLQEARKLDAVIMITQTDWHEATEIDEMQRASNPASSTNLWSGVASPTSRSEGASYASDGASHHSGGAAQANKESLRRRRRHKGSRRHSSGAGGSRRDRKLGGPSSSAADPGLMFLIVSRAALLSVMVAGGVAVAGWWRRAAAAGAGGGGAS